MRNPFLILSCMLIGVMVGCQDEKALKEKEEKKQFLLEELRGAALMSVIQQQYEAAQAKLKRVAELDKLNASDYHLRAEVHVGLGQDQLALDDYNQTIQMNPKDPNAFTGRGRLLIKMGKTNEGKADLDKAKQLGAEN